MKKKEKADFLTEILAPELFACSKFILQLMKSLRWVDLLNTFFSSRLHSHGEDKCVYTPVVFP